ncbi:prepilin-type N-terminal cleavage/methylation domain-containing protein [Lachnospiraceae bacterium NE2001]|nr:prepilin-type N-terminal cleavage/methylation domain-containing protein [Lachnospiraceae bacterium NE2001]
MKKNRGFTLVELIVVLVILAVLAAVLVPALLGYIDKAKEKKDLLRAKACLDAAQAGLAQEYGKRC